MNNKLHVINGCLGKGEVESSILSCSTIYHLSPNLCLCLGEEAKIGKRTAATQRARDALR